MPQTIVLRGLPLELLQLGSASYAAASYIGSMGYADEKLSKAPFSRTKACAAPYRYTPCTSQEMSERLRELVAAHEAVMAAQAALRSYSAMDYSEAALGRAEHAAPSPAAPTAPAAADREDMAERLAELCAKFEAAQAAMALADRLACAEPTGAARRVSAPIPDRPLDLEDAAERLAELCAKAAAVPDWAEYVPAAAGRAQRFGAAYAPQPADAADMAERLAELCQKHAGRVAAAALEGALGYAEPAARAARAAPARRVSAPTADQPLELADLAERLAELCAKAAVIPEWAAYAEPAGRAWHTAAPAAEQPLALADLAERLGELCAKADARAATDALADAYAQPTGAARRVSAPIPDRPLDLADAAERLGELAAKAAPVPEWAAYAAPAAGRAQRCKCAYVPPPSLGDMWERLGELVAKAAAARAADAFADTLAFAEAGRPQRKAAALAPQPLELEDMWERLCELAAKAAPIPEWAAYAEPAAPEATTPRSCAGPCRSELLGLADFGERLQELVLAAAV